MMQITEIFHRAGQSMNIPPTKTVYCIRHAQSHYNARRLEQGVKCCFDEDLIDAHITELGKEQAMKLREITRTLEFDLIIVSPLSRAMQTALLAFDQSHHDKIVVEQIVTERLEDACDIGSFPAILETKFASHFSHPMYDQVESSLWWYGSTETQAEAYERIKGLTDPVQINQVVQSVSLAALKKGGDEPDESVLKRVAAFKRMIYERPESKIALVGHGAWLGELAGENFTNCQLRQLEIDSDGKVTLSKQ